MHSTAPAPKMVGSSVGRTASKTDKIMIRSERAHSAACFKPVGDIHLVFYSSIFENDRDACRLSTLLSFDDRCQFGLTGRRKTPTSFRAKSSKYMPILVRCLKIPERLLPSATPSPPSPVAVFV